MVDEWMVYVSGGSVATEKELFSWAQELEDRGAGEILFTSMDHDGTKNGFAIEALDRLAQTGFYSNCCQWWRRKHRPLCRSI